MTMQPAAIATMQTGWQAHLSLGFSRRGNQTVLAERRQYGPLTVQRPFYPEGMPCHLYLLHPPGGVVGGDELDVQIKVEPEAHALLTTPGATKFYRSAGPQSKVTQPSNWQQALLWSGYRKITFCFPVPICNCKAPSIWKKSRLIAWDVSRLGVP